MTPQLQQAIRLLQLSALQLSAEIHTAVESNIMLELEDELADGDDNPSAEPSTAEIDQDTREIGEPSESMPDELPVDTDWGDIYDSPSSYSGSSGGEELPDVGTRTSAQPSLKDHLEWQMNLARFSDADELIANAIIDAINDNGYLEASLEEIQASLDDPDVELDEIEAVLHRVQSFDPPGVGARDARESLLIQLRQLPADTQWRDTATDLIRNHFELLVRQNGPAIRRILKIDEQDLASVIALIQSLAPRPGVTVAPANDDYIVPDVVVSRRQNKWLVELNPEVVPRLRINATYAGLIQRGDSGESADTMRSHLQEARWLLKSLQSRNETLLRVASEIVDKQRDFLEQGPLAMKPMVLRDIAESLGMHESTVSRVTSQKYMATPQGVYELKHFFSSHVGGTEGGEVSATAIREMIRQLVEDEPPGKPLSDSRIALLLEDRGVAIARRTVAKYREAMAIPPSNERKRLL